MDQLESLKTWGAGFGGRHTWMLTSPHPFSGTLPVSPREDRRITPSCSAEGEEKEPLWNTPEHSVLKACPQEKLFYQSYLTNEWERKYPTSTSSSFSCGRKGSTQLQFLLPVLSHMRKKGKIHKEAFVMITAQVHGLTESPGPHHWTETWESFSFPHI